MRAVRFTGVGRPAQIEEVPKPSPGPGQILVRIGGAGVCHSDLHVMQEDFGFEPPFTGSTALNPWAEFNISGQFLCESFGLISPTMPQTASRIGLHYTRVAIDDEPAQATQLFCTMIALAFGPGSGVLICGTGMGEILQVESVEWVE